ncbi:MAG: 5-oxoprolinase subunit PxpA [Candidatus Acidiferrum sp.]
MNSIDLNCDIGELPEALADGSQEALMRYVSSVNIACGAHAGDVRIMRASIEQALRHGVSIGAHPGYEDRTNFGRVELKLTPEQISESVFQQTVVLDRIATQSGAALTHVKAHGALYNQAARNREIARAIAKGVKRWRGDVVLVGLAGSVMLDEFRAAGFSVAAEAFADRRYEHDGSLRSRKFDDAVLREPEEAAIQALRIVLEGNVIDAGGDTIPLQADTICIHGDTPGAVQIAAAVHRRLQGAGIRIRPLTSAMGRTRVTL